MWFALAVCAVIYFIYHFVVSNLNYWKDRNVPHIKPWPLIGNMLPILARKVSITEMIQESYNAFPGTRYMGVFAFRQPQLMLKDLELIKLIGIKDFDYFTNRTVQVTEDVEPILGKNLASLQDQKWRDMRAKLSPAFTSSKMRFMFNLISDCAQQFIKHFEKQKSEVIEVDTKDVCTRFTNDAIASAAFGINLNSLDDKTNEFFLMGKDLTNFSGGWRSLKLLGYSVFPALMRFFKIRLFPTTYMEFFSGIVKGNIFEREQKGLVRPDMIQILLESQKGKGTKRDHEEVTEKEFAVSSEVLAENTESKQIARLSDEDIIAQALVFFFAGFETSATLMCFLCHELAINPDIQEKLQQEIDKTLEECGGNITYEALLGMKYLDMVISETLRLWPPGIAAERICAKDYIIRSEKGEASVLIEKGLSVTIPVYAIHRDAKYFPNPDKFDPDRFSDENKYKILPFSYLPFGVGPRSCIASRFALLESKILCFHLLSKFDLVPTKKTAIPLVLSRKKFLLAPDDGFWVGFRHRVSG